MRMPLLPYRHCASRENAFESRHWHMVLRGTKHATSLYRPAPATHARSAIMLRYAAIFFVIALVAALFGFTGIAVGAAEIAKILFYIFVILFVVSLLWGLMAGTRP
jgi:uncharacterized membrane protein YtjA (UPF0391 family)